MPASRGCKFAAGQDFEIAAGERSANIGG